jgi:DNA-binding XRE family transcriptional regulator
MRVVRNAKSGAGMAVRPSARFSAHVDSSGEPGPDSLRWFKRQTCAACLRSAPSGSGRVWVEPVQLGANSTPYAAFPTRTPPIVLGQRRAGQTKLAAAYLDLQPIKNGLWCLGNQAQRVVSDTWSMITSRQLRAARALAGMDQRALAEASGLSLPTIQRMEASEGVIRGNVESLMKLIAALERADVELINEGAVSDGGGRGVRLKGRA